MPRRRKNQLFNNLNRQVGHSLTDVDRDQNVVPIILLHNYLHGTKSTPLLIEFDDDDHQELQNLLNELDSSSSYNEPYRDDMIDRFLLSNASAKKRAMMQMKCNNLTEIVNDVVGGGAAEEEFKKKLETALYYREAYAIQVNRIPERLMGLHYLVRGCKVGFPKNTGEETIEMRHLQDLIKASWMNDTNPFLHCALCGNPGHPYSICNSSGIYNLLQNRKPDNEEEQLKVLMKSITVRALDPEETWKMRAVNLLHSANNSGECTARRDTGYIYIFVYYGRTPIPQREFLHHLLKLAFPVKLVMVNRLALKDLPIIQRQIGWFAGRLLIPQAAIVFTPCCSAHNTVASETDIIDIPNGSMQMFRISDYELDTLGRFERIHFM